VPEDAYAANGHWGQYIVVIPSLDLVIVRTGDDRDDKTSLAKLITLSMAVAQ
jgi:CubicO group peptidase (beta-lactamase class C family)